MARRPGVADEPPAVRARRLRRVKWLLFIVYAVIFVGTALVADNACMFAHKAVQVVFIVFYLIAIIVLGLWKGSAHCPRCGWNIYLRKTSVPVLAASIPSSCPNCGLDLEKVYDGEGLR